MTRLKEVYLVKTVFKGDHLIPSRYCNIEKIAVHDDHGQWISKKRQGVVTLPDGSVIGRLDDRIGTIYTGNGEVPVYIDHKGFYYPYSYGGVQKAYIYRAFLDLIGDTFVIINN